MSSSTATGCCKTSLFQSRDAKAFRPQHGISGGVAPGGGVLAPIYLDNETFLEADEVEDEALKWCLPTKFVLRKPPITKQPPHRCFGIRGSRRIRFAKLRMRSATRRWLGACGANLTRRLIL
jgi:hypothetical protein